MSSNRFPRTPGGIIQLARRMSEGIEKVGESVPVTMLTQAALDAARADFTVAQADYCAARVALREAYAIFTPAAAVLHGWLTAARPIFVSSFGYRWSADWAAIGFVNHSTAIPKLIGQRFAVANSILGFLKKNPGYEVEKSGVTFANGTGIYNAAVTAGQGVTAARRALDEAMPLRAIPKAALLGLMRTLVKNLDGRMSKGDGRWLDFGLNIPAAPTTASKPTGLEAQFCTATGGVVLVCDPQPYAKRWRFRGRVAGSGPFHLVASATEPIGRTKPIAPGTEMEFIVQAVNGGTQSVPSDPIFFTQPGPTGDGADKDAPAKEGGAERKWNGGRRGVG